MVLHLIKQDTKDVTQISEALMALKTELKQCVECGNVADNELCLICSDSRRDDKLLCIVEDLRDVMAIENTGQYRGKYHILGGLISPIDGIGPEDLNLSDLENRIQNKGVQEVILALSANMEGDTTTFYLTRRLKPLEITISSLSRGISVGGELEYADEITLGRSIAARIKL